MLTEAITWHVLPDGGMPPMGDIVLIEWVDEQRAPGRPTQGVCQGWLAAPTHPNAAATWLDGDGWPIEQTTARVVAWAANPAGTRGDPVAAGRTPELQTERDHLVAEVQALRACLSACAEDTAEAIGLHLQAYGEAHKPQRLAALRAQHAEAMRLLSGQAQAC